VCSIRSNVVGINQAEAIAGSHLSRLIGTSVICVLLRSTNKDQLYTSTHLGRNLKATQSTCHTLHDPKQLHMSAIAKSIRATILMMANSIHCAFTQSFTYTSDREIIYSHICKTEETFHKAVRRTHSSMLHQEVDQEVD
jgi:hypothetical protein